MILTFGPCVIAVAIVIVSFVGLANHNDRMDFAPCDYFATRSIKDTPSRCLRYFMTTDGGQP